MEFVSERQGKMEYQGGCGTYAVPYCMCGQRAWMEREKHLNTCIN